MTRHALPLFCSLLLILAALPVSADWQYTHWGQPRSDVIIAITTANPSFHAPDNSPGAELTVPYSITSPRGKYEFTAHFLFSPDSPGSPDSKLISIKLECQQWTSQFTGALRALLIDSYGAALNRGETIWQSGEGDKRDSITFDPSDFHFKGRCSITIAPLSKGGL